MKINKYPNHHYALVDLICQTSNYPKAIVEVGVWVGDLSESLANTFRSSNIYLVDPWDGRSEGYINNKEAGPISPYLEDYENAYSYVLARFKDFNNVEIVRAPSSVARNRFNSQSLDAVFIDADHSYKGVRNDILYWLPKIKINGLLSGHDFYSNSGVSKAVTETLGDVITTGKTNGNVWAIRVSEGLNERLKGMSPS